uniref:F-box domain-containing protein n=1 Tax=Hyaloperonospora arabidopsidis (strain Emoy2) TaxID=559515 RepID=M4BY85_HYAAE
MARGSVFDLLGQMQCSASRLHQRVNEHLGVLSSTVTTSPGNTFLTVSSTCSFRSTFVQCPPREPKVTSKSGKTITFIAKSDNFLEGLSIDEVTFLVLSFLDAASISRVQGVSRTWRTFIQQYREPIYRALIQESQVYGQAIISSSSFMSYLCMLRYDLDRELTHALAVHPTHEILEHYCKLTTEHGFVAMFCDIVEFRDPKIACAVARKRQSALSTVLTATPDHVMKFRKRSRYVGPITFVPVDNPLWPVFDFPPVDTPGFMGYAFDHVAMVEGYQTLKNTIVKSILKDLMIFDTAASAEAYGDTIGRAPYAAILEVEDAQVHAIQLERDNQLSFSSQLRRHLADKYPFTERIQRLQAKIKAVDNCIAATASAGKSYSQLHTPTAQ